MTAVWVALAWFACGITVAAFFAAIFKGADYFDRLEQPDTDCPTPLSHPIDACARRNGAQL